LTNLFRTFGITVKYSCDLFLIIFYLNIKMLVQHKTNNLLIIKDDVGKAKPSMRLLPQFGHSYGYAPPPDKEGVGQLLTNWTFHQ